MLARTPNTIAWGRIQVKHLFHIPGHRVDWVVYLRFVRSITLPKPNEFPCRILLGLAARGPWWWWPSKQLDYGPLLARTVSQISLWLHTFTYYRHSTYSCMIDRNSYCGGTVAAWATITAAAAAPMLRQTVARHVCRFSRFMCPYTSNRLPGQMVYSVYGMTIDGSGVHSVQKHHQQR